MKARFLTLVLLIGGMLTPSSYLIAQYYSYSSNYQQGYYGDLSDDLDLHAVANVFAQARNLQDFEFQLNNYRNKISNLDLNNDGYVDYLRVVESSQGNLRLIIIQAVLDMNVFQNVATIIADYDAYHNPYMQIVGDPYIYGYDYVIEPTFTIYPPLFGWFWSTYYRPWVSPYYWGYYPSQYHRYHYVHTHTYYARIRKYDHSHNYCTYHYPSRPRYDYRYDSHYTNTSRNDYATRYPDRSFGTRNSSYSNVRNSHDLQSTRNSVNTSSRDNTTSTSGTRNSQSSTTTRNSENTSGSRTSTAPQTGTRSTESNRTGTSTSTRQSSTSTNNNTSTRNNTSSQGSNATSTRSSSGASGSRETSTQSSNSTSSRSTSGSSGSVNSSSSRNNSQSTVRNSSSTSSRSSGTTSVQGGSTRSSANQSSSRGSNSNSSSTSNENNGGGSRGR